MWQDLVSFEEPMCDILFPTMYSETARLEGVNETGEWVSNTRKWHSVEGSVNATQTGTQEM